jgi:cytochrome c
VRVTAREDGSLEDGGIPAERVTVTAEYLQDGVAAAPAAQGHQSPPAAHAAGRALVEEGTCLSCHQLDQASIGPSYTAVAERYRGDAGAAAHLVRKIREGGAGAWGDMMMPPHPQVTEVEAAQMSAYILSLGEPSAGSSSLPVRGEHMPPTDAAGAAGGAVVLRATYTDRGADGVPSASAEQVLVLRAPTVVVSSGELSEGVSRMQVPQMPVEMTIVSQSGSYVRFEQLDLSGISEISFLAVAPEQMQGLGGTVEVRLGSADGPLVGETERIPPEGEPAPVRATIAPTTGMHDVYFVFRNPEAEAGRSLFIVLTASFGSGSGPAAPDP